MRVSTHRVQPPCKVAICDVEIGEHGDLPIGDSIRRSRRPARQRQVRRCISESRAARPVARPLSLTRVALARGFGGTLPDVKTRAAHLPRASCRYKKPRPKDRGFTLTQWRALPPGSPRQHRFHPPERPAFQWLFPASGTSRATIPSQPPTARPRSQSPPS